MKELNRAMLELVHLGIAYKQVGKELHTRLFKLSIYRRKLKLTSYKGDTAITTASELWFTLKQLGLRK